jgi:hypothetical protein
MNYESPLITLYEIDTAISLQLSSEGTPPEDPDHWLVSEEFTGYDPIKTTST